MSEEPGQELDWTHLPADSDIESLWESLHDGELISCTSNLIEQQVILECRVEHLLPASSGEVIFSLQLEKVSSARANVWVRWPGQFTVPKGVSREEESRLIAEYHAKWREESLSWSEFEIALAADSLMIAEAEFAQRNGEVALKIGGFLDSEKFNDQYCSIFLRGGSLTASRSDGQVFSFDQFLELGRQYWEAFADRKKGESS